MTITFQPESKLMQALIEVLEHEQKILVSNDIIAIEMLMDEKTQLLQKINAASQARYRALQAKGYAPSEVGMEAFIQSDNNLQDKNTWINFQRLLTLAKELNRVNGVLINRHFNRNRETLNDLQGNHSARMIYGANGQHAVTGYSGSSLIV
ncbi:MAG: flagellar protein FlgN [Methylophilaceae bacterium]|nr:flagellar protein FlgN [Methylophilaceae bacterium]